MVGFSLKPKDTTAKGKPGIKLGFSLKKMTPLNQNKKKQAFSNHDSDDEGAKVAIDSFDIAKGGAISGDKATDYKAPLVIMPPSNENWIDILKKQNVYKPNQEHQQPIEPQDTAEKLQYGLNIMKSDVQETVEVQTATIKENMVSLSSDEIARNSLINNQSTKRKLTIPKPLEAAENEDTSDPFEKYEEVPIEDFGAALLRGMGWEEDSNDVKEEYKPPAARSRSLGIGAKQVAVSDDVGDWGKSRVYVPLVKRNKRTGEIIRDDDGSRESHSRERNRSPKRDKSENYRERVYIKRG